jgi:cytochrome c-type biogenesis protein CcmH/NrfG
VCRNRFFDPANQMKEFRVSARPVALAAVLAAALSIPLQVHAADATQPQSAPEVKSLIAASEAQLAEGKVDEAIATLSNAVAADPKSSQAYTRLGGARLVKQEFSAAIGDFRSALAADPNNADAFIGMALAYLHSADYALARAALGEARRLAPEKAPKIDEVLIYMDQREGSAGLPAGH